MTKAERKELRKTVTYHWTSSAQDFTTLALLNEIDNKDDIIADLVNCLNELLEATNCDDITKSSDWLAFDRKLEQLKVRAAE